MAKDDGGPAFLGRYWDGQKKADHFGMSLRDYFAARAMQILEQDIDTTCKQIAEHSYNIADAMIAERRRGG